ncbi:MAG: 2-C-methyl-D-erythritol 4-phosphate cytidylyltransferase [Candidatus Latescibacteria bacterium]|nr:2-C-methyl-D-erythritol 4-phosphate cytidylyltransferase [Candidatus Latescibacterota bacterium]
MAHRVVAVVVAAGSGVRFGGDVPKQYTLLAGRPMLVWSLQACAKCDSIDDIVVVVPAGDEKFVAEDVVAANDISGVSRIVAGGATRQESTFLGIEALPTSTFAVVHDAARPVLGQQDLSSVVSEAVASQGAILATPVTDTIKRLNEDGGLETVDRDGLWAAQTPQVFEVGVLKKAMEQAFTDGFSATDEASLVERIGVEVRIVRSEEINLKVTTAEDMETAERILLRREI